MLTPTLSIPAGTTCYQDRGQGPERGRECAYPGEVCVMGVLHPQSRPQAGLRVCVLLGTTVGPQWVAVGQGQVSEPLSLSVCVCGPGSQAGEWRCDHQALPSTCALLCRPSPEPVLAGADASVPSSHPLWGYGSVRPERQSRVCADHSVPNSHHLHRPRLFPREKQTGLLQTHRPAFPVTGGDTECAGALQRQMRLHTHTLGYFMTP